MQFILYIEMYLNFTQIKFLCFPSFATRILLARNFVPVQEYYPGKRSLKGMDTAQ